MMLNVMKKNSMKPKWNKFNKSKNFEKKKKLKVNEKKYFDFFFHFEFNSEDPKEADKSNDTFAARMQLQVIRNLELSIENIHIVYEDKSTKPSHPFAMGITLNYIKLRVEWFRDYSELSIIAFLFHLDNNSRLGTDNLKRGYTVNS